MAQKTYLAVAHDERTNSDSAKIGDDQERSAMIRRDRR